MRLGHGLVESIERLSDGKDLALGARTAMDMYGHLAPDRNILFGGLGLGVVQRGFALDSSSITCEINRGVIDAFDFVYPDLTNRIHVVEQDLFEYVFAPPEGAAHSMALLDFFDPEDRALSDDFLARALKIARVVVINTHIATQDELHRCEMAIERLPFPVRRHLVEGKQLILAVGPLHA
jgi:hypothetical protein